MNDNPLKKLGTLGQSIWLDYIRRDLIVSGELRRLIEKDGLRGMTSNPSIFEKAIAGSHDYDGDIRAMMLDGKGVKAIYEALSQRDVQSAADEFRPLYDKTEAKDGYVSLEVNPHLAHDTRGTMEEARRLWAALNRPNVFIKVPRPRRTERPYRTRGCEGPQDVRPTAGTGYQHRQSDATA
jgi:transaldolase